MSQSAPHVGLYVTCLVDIMRPSVGFATVFLLEAAGCRVTVPSAQSCCGQPALNSGDQQTAKALAIQFVQKFRDFDYVVAPSASCAAMLKMHIPDLLSDDDKVGELASEIAKRVYELSEFLVSVMAFTPEETGADACGRVTYHDGCSGLRELGLDEAPRRLLNALPNIEFVDAPNGETCCGFGGTFSIRYPDISNAMVTKKCSALDSTTANIITGCELGCLMHIAGKFSRLNSEMNCYHLAELLAGKMRPPAIGQKKI